MKVYDLEEYRQRKQLTNTLEELKDMKEQIYSECGPDEQLGYERFKRLIEIMISDKPMAQDNFDHEENSD